MGRVYNALVKADRWKDHSRMVGGPNDPAGAPHQNGDRSEGAEAAYQAGAPWNEYRAAAREDDYRVSRSSSLFTEHPAALLRVAPEPPPPPVFIEPRASASIRDLRLDPHLPALTGNDELASERYRTLAVRLLNLGSRRKLRTILVTSARPQEGKTTVAANLAWVMSKASERRVLLMDADLRIPTVCRKLGLSPRRGWLDLIDRNSELPDALVRLDPNGLYVLAPRSSLDAYAGPVRPGASSALTPTDAITSSRVDALIKELENQFDFIVIDAPPILEFADAQRLSSIVDGTLLVVRAGQTRFNLVTDALKLVPKEHRLGVVLNEAQVDAEMAYYSRHKGSGKAGSFGRKG
ncbi:MAG TPA: CpsD/CapB family tyrosine-protein kinase [Blastocatellia bacterium]|nr:CpsD/CapB family tyrosine-protein kinase [Blastocatellia bacterium]